MNHYMIEIDEEQRQILLLALSTLSQCKVDNVSKVMKLFGDFIALPADQAASPSKVIAFCE